ncbi:hypothetical protein [Calothrix sp. PCC 7507]|uniref:hypothetical protein n=1 Tax=Calothrix sp. PCC 7507 TaxID=99598 RepID=UPI00029F1F94|nr:hypothetical protein [Calothrix sp. PCC 7507]AFY31207.1 hypothetical protein Cal7507_0718 [Calothrix sp. PCC 7507]
MDNIEQTEADIEESKIGFGATQRQVFEFIWRLLLMGESAFRIHDSSIFWLLIFSKADVLAAGDSVSTVDFVTQPFMAFHNNISRAIAEKIFAKVGGTISLASTLGTESTFRLIWTKHPDEQTCSSSRRTMFVCNSHQ